jgi:hypothetical protein
MSPRRCAPTVVRMANRANAEARQTYLVEHYRPGATVDELRQWAALIRGAADELERCGRSVRYLRSTIVPADESLLCVFESAGEEPLRATYARAGLAFERLSAVIPAEDNVRAAIVDDVREETR